ncbi:IS66 family transposase [Nitrosomonas supralitoralis]|nr:IS66 family transposase [Nitrosomonas supralitoralis]
MKSNNLQISENAIRAYNLCTRKSYLLIFSSVLSAPNDYEKMQNSLKNITRQNYLHSISNHLIIESFSSFALTEGIDIYTNVTLSDKSFSMKNVNLIKVPDDLCLDKSRYEPIIFSSFNKIKPEDKAELSFIGYILSKCLGYLPDNGHVILIDGRTIALKLFINLQKYLPIIDTLQGWLTQNSDSPPVTLNKHCPYCEFQHACKKTALQEDNLSLLGGISKKQILKFEKKGIFTIKQLSFLYRPRKRWRRSRLERVVHKYELQALALRTGNIYIQDKLVEIPKHDVEIFIDFECLPDESFFYLFGLVVCQAGKQDNFQFWATSKKNEEAAWKDFVSIIAQYGNSPLFHYGSFENKAILTLGKRYETPTKTIVERLFNINTCIYGKLYFPVYSNCLKDICNYLGLPWSSPNASGLQSIVWRHEYDQSKDDIYRNLLQTYNIEDCLNLKGLTEYLREISADAAHSEQIRFADNEGGSMPESASNLSKQLSNILLSAHGTYEQKKIRLKNKGSVITATDDSGDNKKKLLISKGRKDNKIVHVRQGRICPKHPGRKFKPTQIETSRTIFDLIFTTRGIKKNIIRYIGKKGNCTACHHKYDPPQIRKLGVGKMYGQGFIAWVSYQRLAMRLPFNKIAQLIEDSFGEYVSQGTIVELFLNLSAFYSETEQKLLKQILKNPFIHMDETTINIRGASQYVWVITDGTHVIFKLSENREATIVHEFLGGYKGVLCSDFYGGYDSVPCLQQKCWAHLIRDLNENLRKSPFDAEFENFVCAVGALITPILQAVEKYGLKIRHLRKFRSNVDSFYKNFINNKTYTSDVTQTFQKRFQKYRERLFVFLDIEGIPWNNNAAERALRHIAVQRKISGSFGKESTPHYLRLLSVTQTCRFQNKSLLQFLLSGEKDIDKFKGSKGLVGWRMH